LIPGQLISELCSFGEKNCLQKQKECLRSFCFDVCLFGTLFLLLECSLFVRFVVELQEVSDC
jgi:hypothetical protein